jgi:hypothetical protein
LGADAGPATRPLCELFRDPGTDPETRRHVAWVLGNIGSAAGESRGLLADAAALPGDDTLRIACVAALQRIGNITSEQQSQLVTILLDDNEAHELRAAAGTTRASLTALPPVLLPSLIGLCGAVDDWETLAELVHAIAQIPDRAGR